MPVTSGQLEAIRDQALAQMQSLLASEEPTITVNDEEVPWAPLLASLERTVDWCDRKLGEYQPYEVSTRAGT
jgi:hypothetical protein